MTTTATATPVDAGQPPPYFDALVVTEAAGEATPADLAILEAGAPGITEQLPDLRAPP